MVQDVTPGQPTCPPCRKSVHSTLPTAARGYLVTGRTRMTFMSLTATLLLGLTASACSTPTKGTQAPGTAKADATPPSTSGAPGPVGVSDLPPRRDPYRS
ncbi:hypothetical protein GCM10010411_75120 [Actinomadura fulvescens]|uniref:Uncharacterized protein n=1 Tax=Actinomadura fulvescens TaxID=46160 RepID=A0ABN3QIP8_9ACTN